MTRQDCSGVLHVKGSLDPGLTQVTELPEDGGDDREEEQAREREVREPGHETVQDARNETRTQEATDRPAHRLVRGDVLCEPSAASTKELTSPHGRRVRCERRRECEKRNPCALLQRAMAPEQGEAGDEPTQVDGTNHEPEGLKLPLHDRLRKREAHEQGENDPANHEIDPPAKNEREFVERVQVEGEEKPVDEDGRRHHHKPISLSRPDDLSELPGGDTHRQTTDPPPRPVRHEVEEGPERGNAHPCYQKTP